MGVKERVLDKHKKKLMSVVSDEVTQLFEQVLDYAEVAIIHPEQYKKFRAKVLRVGNNCIRKIGKEVDDSFTVQFNPPGEIVVEFKQLVKKSSAENM